MEARRAPDDHATAPDDARVDSGRTPGIMVIPRLHLRIKTPTEDDMRKCEELREAVSHTHFWAHPPHRAWLSDQTLLRFLIAREFQVDKALEMLQTALAWRASREPHTLRASMQEMQFQGQTGKIYLAGTDRWGRPVVVFNNSVNNSNDPRAQMRYLAFNLETALRKARAGGGAVTKFIIFMHLTDFSLFNCPPLKVTRETIQIVTTSYPETMGHCVIYQPPYVFSAFYDSVKRFIDKRTASKIIMLTGDVSAGSANDQAMRELIGEDWQALTGVGQPRIKEGCSPGFDFDAYWPRLAAEEARLLSLEKEEEEQEAEAAKKRGHAHKHHHGHPRHRRSRGHGHGHGHGGGGREPASAPAPAAATVAAALGAAARLPPSAADPPRAQQQQQSPQQPMAAENGAGEGKLWRAKRQSSLLASVGIVAAASAISAAAAAAAAAISVPGERSGASSSSTGATALLSASLAALLGLFGFAPPAAAAAAAAGPLPWLVKSGDGSALPGEGLVLLVMGLLCASILCAYPNPYCPAVLGRLRARGRALPGEPRALMPLPNAPTKTVVTAGRVLSEEARRRR